MLPNNNKKMEQQFRMQFWQNKISVFFEWFQLWLNTLYTKIWYKAMTNSNILNLKMNLQIWFYRVIIYNMSDERFSTIAQKNMSFFATIKATLLLEWVRL